MYMYVETNLGVIRVFCVKLPQCNINRWLLAGRTYKFQAYRALGGIHEQLEGATKTSMCMQNLLVS